MDISGYKQSWGVASAVLAASLLSGCATDSGVPPVGAALSSVDLNAGVSSGELIPRAESVLLVLDGSSSMSSTYNVPVFSASKFMAEKQIATLFSNTMPEIGIDGEVASFGFGECHGWKMTNVNMPMSPFSQSAMSEAIGAIPCSSGGTPMSTAMLAIEDDIRNAKGRVAMIMMSDGLPTDSDPVAYAEALKAEFGDKLCIHTIWIGNNPSGQAVMSAVANASGCGVAVSGDQVADAGGMSGFIADAIFEKGHPVIDSDGDGVPDASDKCPGTPRGVAVDADGCPLDTDGDGVPDYKDRCPNTPKGAKVNSQGCWSVGHVNFDFDSADISANAYPELNNIVDILRANPNMQITLEGHTDSVGPESYNLGLSERRAKSVMNYLVRKGTTANRLSSAGFGETRPIEDNKSDSGRAANRRVDLNITSR
jgi:OOP family OmpA-OmpF porin